MELVVMTSEKFSEIKNELINVVVEFEQTERKIQFLNSTYLLEFYNELEQQRYLQYENEYLIKAIAMSSDGKTEAEIKEFLEQCRKEFDGQMQNFYRQHQLAKELEHQISMFTKEDIESLDLEFIEYCSLHHPLVNLYATIIEKNLYSTLISLYRLGNITGYKNFIKEFSSSFTTVEIPVEEYEKVVKIYQETILHLKNAIQQKKQEFPLNKEDIFYKEELLTRELMYLREKNYKAREMNKSLQKDFKLHFTFEFSL
ncbi:MAG: hypothetical protein NC310_03725 [Roseburia sp.]|nr:hypothetical protein [Anaeroplasma bactoclasticum]MCM1196168.1 hypothetical protein [Roseburia sp.]MCM1556256.1 hypothetical protein [Anaeroplasma bactoclasticum]